MEEETNTQSEQAPPPDVTQVNTESAPEPSDTDKAELPSDGETVVEGVQEETTESTTETTGEATPSEG